MIVNCNGQISVYEATDLTANGNPGCHDVDVQISSIFFAWNNFKYIFMHANVFAFFYNDEERKLENL
jgi:hypothetical protein